MKITTDKRRFQTIALVANKLLALFILCFILIFSISSLNPIGEEESKPLLRVFPIFRPEECEWAIRFDICLRCIARKERYAQKIYFLKEDGPYREHGCFTDEKGFYPLK